MNTKRSKQEQTQIDKDSEVENLNKIDPEPNLLRHKGLNNIPSGSMSMPEPKMVAIKPVIPKSKSSHNIHLSIVDDVNTNTVNSTPDIDEILAEPLPSQTDLRLVRKAKSESNVSLSFSDLQLKVNKCEKLSSPKSSMSPRTASLRLRSNKKTCGNLSIPILLEDDGTANIADDDHVHNQILSQVDFGPHQSKMMKIGFKKNVSAPVFGAINSKLDVMESKDKVNNKHAKNISISMSITGITTEGTEKNLTIPVHRASKSEGNAKMDDVDIAGTIRSLNSLRGFGFFCAMKEMDLTDKLKSYQKIQQKHRAFTQ